MSNESRSKKSILSRRAKFIAAAIISQTGCSKSETSIKPESITNQARPDAGATAQPTQSTQPTQSPPPVDAYVTPPMDCLSVMEVKLDAGVTDAGSIGAKICLSVRMITDAEPRPLVCLSPRKPPY